MRIPGVTRKKTTIESIIAPMKAIVDQLQAYQDEIFLQAQEAQKMSDNLQDQADALVRESNDARDLHAKYSALTTFGSDVKIAAE